jgi:hypothetical protein
MFAKDVWTLVFFVCFLCLKSTNALEGVIRRVETHVSTHTFERAVRAVVQQPQPELPNAAGVKTALLIHAGLMRGYKKLWRTWEKNFIKPNEDDGVRFTIAVSTNLRAYCDPDDPSAWHNGRLCKTFPRSLDQAQEIESFKQEIMETYGPSSKGGPVYVHNMELDGSVVWNKVHARAMPILRMYENQTFDYIIVTRPDIVLANARNAHEDGVDNTYKAFELKSLCESRPGLNIISASYTRGDNVHHRDWDWGYMLCEGRNKEDASPVLFGNTTECSTRLERARQANVTCVPPKRSADFIAGGGLRFAWSCQSRACSWFEGMEGKKMRFGTLDNILYGLMPSESHPIFKGDAMATK